MNLKKGLFTAHVFVLKQNEETTFDKKNSLLFDQKLCKNYF